MSYLQSTVMHSSSVQNLFSLLMFLLPFFILSILHKNERISHSSLFFHQSKSGRWQNVSNLEVDWNWEYRVLLKFYTTLQDSVPIFSWAHKLFHWNLFLFCHGSQLSECEVPSCFMFHCHFKVPVIDNSSY